MATKKKQVSGRSGKIAVTADRISDEAIDSRMEKLLSVDVSALNLEELTVEQLDDLRSRALEAKRAKMPKPLSANAKNNKLGIEKHVTSILQCVRVLVKEGAFDCSLDFINSQLARLDPETLVENAMNSPERSLRGRAAAAEKAAKAKGQ